MGNPQFKSIRIRDFYRYADFLKMFREAERYLVFFRYCQCDDNLIFSRNGEIHKRIINRDDFQISRLFIFCKTIHSRSQVMEIVYGLIPAFDIIQCKHDTAIAEILIGNQSDRINLICRFDLKRNNNLGNDSFCEGISIRSQNVTGHLIKPRRRQIHIRT